VPEERPSADEEFVEFYESGTHVTGKFNCAACGYGVVCRNALPRCPMCQESTWEASVLRPFTRGTDGVHAKHRNCASEPGGERTGERGAAAGDVGAAARRARG
jgi:hypothetical protein